MFDNVLNPWKRYPTNTIKITMVENIIISFNQGLKKNVDEKKV